MDKTGIIFQIKRMWFETFLLILMGVLLYYTSGVDEPVLRLFAFKVLLFSASQLHAHITRHILFPYIKFNETEAYQRGLIIAIHVSAAYLYAQGG